MSKCGKVARWAQVKTVAGLLDLSVSEVRSNVRRKRWQARRLGRARNCRILIALGCDGWPVKAKA